MRRALAGIVSSLLLGLGMVFLTSPFLLWWWILGSNELYVWITGGPYPYDDLGGRPFQVAVYPGSFATGFVLTSLALVLRSLVRHPV